MPPVQTSPIGKERTAQSMISQDHSEVNVNPSANKLVCILSIDGGGVRGIIPAIILAFLEEELQYLEKNNGPAANNMPRESMVEEYFELKVGGPNIEGKSGRSTKSIEDASRRQKARIADYFDVVAGTSTGSIVASMLTIPDDSSPPRPRFTALEIIDCYLKDSQRIFSEDSKIAERGVKSRKTELSFSWKGFKELCKRAVSYAGDKLSKPIYDPKQLKEVVHERAKDISLDQTVKPLIIPSYSLNKLVPHIFSTELVIMKRQKNMPLADVVLSSTAAPIYFPAHSIKIDNETYEFSDGGVAAANNPALIAIGEVVKRGGQVATFSNCLLLSLGTGQPPKEAQARIVKPAYDGGFLNWLMPGAGRGATPPIIDILFDSMGFMVDIYLARIFRGLNNYLRIQEYELNEELIDMDVASLDNLYKLGKTAIDLMTKPISVIDPDTLEFDKSADRPTYRQAMQEFAETLWRERKRRNMNGSVRKN
ncbi:patatin-like protein 2 [Malania oleifera]|uniref:patatin-like protein 2 n=1 Tax=Malania oleifera TaxID=397392 RepID=UPI0025ADD6B5|nr:patatin-like protein 2 [Malania oleifera]